MISTVILTHNNQETIAKLVKQLSFCNQIIAIDDYSIDNTVSVLKKLKVEVHQRPLNNDFSSQRNYGLQIAASKWVLFIDPDELLSQRLKQAIITAISKPSSIQGYFITRKDIFLGKQLRYGEAGQLKLLRLAKKSAGSWDRPVHETWRVRGETGSLPGFLLHQSHRNLSSFIDKINFYTTIEEEYRFKQSHNFSLPETLIYPLVKFIYNYFFKLGFMDGYQGLIMAYVMSLHSLLVRLKTYHETT